MSDRKEYHRQWNEKNKDRIKQQKKEYYQQTKKERTDTDIKYKYGISLEQYNTMRKDQNYSCVCCGITEIELEELYPNSQHKKLFIDHCHESKKVRALLCGRCNTFIGYIEKRADLLDIVLKYINEHKQR